MRLSKFKNQFLKIREGSAPLVRGLVFFTLTVASLFAGHWINQNFDHLFNLEEQVAVIYTENEQLAIGVQDLVFSDWKLNVVIIDEPTEWEIKTLEGRGAHLILVDYKKMEDLNRKGLIEKANVRVPLFSYLATDFKKSDWEKIFLPLFWMSQGPKLSDINIWGLSVPKNTPNRKLSWKAFFEIVRHPLFKAKLAGTELGLTLEEFEESPIAQTRKPGFVRQRFIEVDKNK